MILFWVRALLVGCLLLGIWACKGEEPINCQDAPLVTFANLGKGFMTESCQGCHASTAVNRHDAPEDLTFDNVDQVWQNADLILDAATGPEPFMPPQGGVFPEDRRRLEIWLRCTEVGN